MMAMKPDMFDVISSSVADVVRLSLNTAFREESQLLLEVSSTKELESKLNSLVRAVVEGKAAANKLKTQRKTQSVEKGGPPQDSNSSQRTQPKTPKQQGSAATANIPVVASASEASASATSTSVTSTSVTSTSVTSTSVTSTSVTSTASVASNSTASASVASAAGLDALDAGRIDKKLCNDEPSMTSEQPESDEEMHLDWD